jgi:hypothetical protein
MTSAANVTFGLVIQPPGGTNQQMTRVQNWGGGFDAHIGYDFVMTANQFFIINGYHNAANGYSVAISLTYEPSI